MRLRKLSVNFQYAPVRKIIEHNKISAVRECIHTPIKIILYVTNNKNRNFPNRTQQNNEARITWYHGGVITSFIKHEI